MVRDGFRLVLSYDTEKEKFTARIPELGDVHGEGQTRAEALAAAEEALEKAFRQAAEEGNEMPVPLDGREFSGELHLKLSASAHRELTFLANQEGLEPEQLAAEMLAAAIATRIAGRRRPHHEDRPRDEQPREDRPPRGEGRRGRQGGGRGYFNIMDDKASFLEYVRGLDDRSRPPKRRGGRGREDE